MKRDSIKTIAGLIIIVGIVVATFLYGNAQRKAQLAHDQQVKAQQQASATPKSSATPTPTKSPTPVVAANTPAPSAVPQTGGTGEALPQTGPEMAGMLGLGSIGVMTLAVRRSRRAMLDAARSKR